MIKVDDEKLTPDMQKDQLDLLFKQAPPAFALLIIVTICMVVVLWKKIEPFTLLLWLFISVSSIIIRLLLIYVYHKKKPAFIAPWRRWFITLTGFTGIIWGTGTLLFLQQLDSTYQMFVIVMLAGVTAGAQATFSSSPANGRTFLLPCLLIPSSWMLWQDEITLLVIGFLAILYAGLLWILNTRHFLLLKRSLILSYKNDTLVSELEQEVGERRHSESELLQKNQHMEALLRLDQALARAESHTDIIDVTATEIERVLGYQVAWLYLPTDKQDIWHLLASKTTRQSKVRIQAMTFSQSSSPILIEDARTDPHGHQDTLALLDNRSMIIIPMFSANTALGALATGSCGDEGINIPHDSQLSLLSAMAAHVALTLDRVNQFNDRLKIQAQLEHAQRMDSLGLMAGGIAHDFNNILTAITGNASLAGIELGEIELDKLEPGKTESAETKPEDTNRTRHHLDLILQSSKHAADLCNQMLAYSGKGHFIIETVDISDTVRNVTAMIGASIGKHVNIEYNLSSGLSAIKVDVTQLQQVIMNLLINASEAVADNGGQIIMTTGQVDADTAMLAACYGESPPAGSYVYLDVSDNGCGMDEEVASKLFDPFFTTKFTGRGLGMSAILGIVRGHHGAILIDTVPAKGTTFRILLPVATEQPSKQQALNAPIKERNDITPTNNDNATILVIDDEQLVIDVAQQILQHAGHDVLTATGGKDALQLYHQHHPSIALILLDLTMPEMSGKECFHQLLAINAQAKVMIVSGYSEEDVMAQFDGFQMAGFIRKPYEIQGFLNDVNHALSDRIN